MHRLAALALIGMIACTTDPDDKVDETDVQETDVVVDGDNDGAASDVDCDDADPNNFPGNREVCDGGDNDCDGIVDDADDSLDATTANTYFADVDQDGFGAAELGVFCEAPLNSALEGGDCDDSEDSAFPGNAEICDGIDNDCDDLLDDEDTLDPAAVRVWFLDADNDGFGDDATRFEACDGADAVGVGGDCNDDNDAIHPAATEVCDDGIDNNCNTLADDDDPVLDTTTARTWWTDLDGDGYGVSGTSFMACEASNAALQAGDCDDDPFTGAAINPGAPEIPVDGVDQDCDTTERCYVDADADTWGGATLTSAADLSCTTTGLAARTGDCNEANSAIHPGATEVCDGLVDNDCDGAADDDDASVDLTGRPTYFLDPDTDTWGTPGTGFQACDGGGLPTRGGDCGPDEGDVFPGAPEVCDGKDNDCDPFIDADDPNFVTATGTTRYVDADGDSFGTGPAVDVCIGDPGYADDDGDCDDGDATVNPGAREVCNGKDDDCAGGTDDADPNLDLSTATTFYTDADNDDFGLTASAVTQCAAPAGNVATAGGDCDDGDADVNPDATEVCDGIDNDCVNGIDGIDAWAYDTLPYRIPITISAPGTWSVDGIPVAIDVDFGAALADLGDTSGLDKDAIRVVNQDCALGQPELPSEWIDGITEVFDKKPLFDAANNGVGALTFLYDEDGDYASRERLAAGTSGEFAVYFASNATSGGIAAPSYSTTLVASTDGLTGELSNARVEALFDASSGGITDYLAATGRPSTGAQTSTLLGNGIFMGPPTGGGGSWVSASEPDTAGLTLVHAGPVFSALRTNGTASNAYGGYEFIYVYFLFEGRPEVYVKTRFTLTQDSAIGPQTPFWGASVRPFMVNNNALSSAALSEGGADIPGYTWARGGYATGGANAYGIAVGYRETVALRSRPVYSPTADPNAGRYVGLAGQDLSSTFVSGETVYAGQAGDRILDWPIIAIYPHNGLFSTVSVDFYGTIEGATTAMSPVESNL